VTNFWRGLKATVDEFLETKRDFFLEWAPSKNPLLVFTNLSYFGRYKEIFGPYFSGICQIYFPKKISWTIVDKPPHQFDLEIRSDLLLDYLKQKLNIDEEVFISISFGS
jgi:hypothetical protein